MIHKLWQYPLMSVSSALVGPLGDDPGKYQFLVSYGDDKGIPYLGKIFFGQWWRKFDDSGLSKKTIQIRLIRQPTESSTSSVSKLISHIEKRKLQPEDKEKLKALLEESENEDDIMNLGSDSDEDYNPCLDIYSQDPNEF